MTPSEEIKSKLNIIDVVKDYIQLKQMGSNFSARCPFHNEKSASFMVSQEKQIWHCFGCGKGGDVLSFVQEIEGVSFPETLRLLAPRAGVNLENYKLSPQDSGKTRLFNLVEAATEFYNRVLTSDQAAASARQYLLQRGLTKEIIEDWSLGFSRDSWDDLINYLKAKGYNEKEIAEAGLSAQKSGTNRFYNRFRNRIMFPLCDVNNNGVGFTARVLPENDGKDGLGKYINTPQSTVYDKSRLLFGLNKAKTKIKQLDYAVVVEGQMDCITAHQFGFTNVVASSGTAFTEEQINLLKRYTNNIMLAFDMDKAGVLAADRSIEQALKADFNIKVISLPEGKDPDECIRKNLSGWEEALKNAKPFMEYYFDKTFSTLDLKLATNRKLAAKQILAMIVKLPSKIDQDFWIKRLADKIDVQAQFLYEALGSSSNTLNKVKKYSLDDASKVKTSGRGELLSESLISLLLKYSVNLAKAPDIIIPENLVGLSNIVIYNYLIIYYNTNYQGVVNNFVLDYANFKIWLEQQLKPEQKKIVLELDRISLLINGHYANLEASEASLEIVKIANVLKKRHLSLRLREVSRLIAEAEQSSKIEVKQNLNNLLLEFNSLAQELRQLESLSE